MQDRTEEATPKRLQDARTRGEVARSADLTSAAGLLAVALTASWSLPNLFGGLRAVLEEQFHHLVRADLTLDSAVTLAWDATWTLVVLVWPVLAAALLAGVVTSVAQTGGLLTLHPLGPNFGRMNPIAGASQLFSMRSLLELAKTLAKLAIGGAVAWQVLGRHTAELAARAGSDLTDILSAVAAAGNELMVNTGLALGTLAAADYFVQRWQHRRQLRMSRQDIKEEFRESEGDPTVRAMLRRRQRQLATRRMMAAVPTADIVVTNPTHIAVALAYRQGGAAAPRVVAKGQLLVAERIKAVARAAGVPVQENVPLARALYRSVEVGQEIPATLYQAVAEVLAFVYRTKGRR